MKQLSILLVVSSLLLAACGGTPIPDIEATVQAAIAATQAAQSTATVTPIPPTSTPTATPQPTNTSAPTVTPQPTRTPTPKPPTATPTVEPIIPEGWLMYEILSGGVIITYPPTWEVVTENPNSAELQNMQDENEFLFIAKVSADLNSEFDE